MPSAVDALPAQMGISNRASGSVVRKTLAFRSFNPPFEPIWNRRYVDYAYITFAEEAGVEHPGGYYDQAGALRNMVQNHLLQMLCLMTGTPHTARPIASFSTEVPPFDTVMADPRRLAKAESTSEHVTSGVSVRSGMHRGKTVSNSLRCSLAD
jgi:glucose-6-phosphate 1-dehydrogenase